MPMPPRHCLRFRFRIRIHYSFTTVNCLKNVNATPECAPRKYQPDLREVNARAVPIKSKSRLKKLGTFFCEVLGGGLQKPC